MLAKGKLRPSRDRLLRMWNSVTEEMEYTWET